MVLFMELNELLEKIYKEYPDCPKMVAEDVTIEILQEYSNDLYEQYGFSDLLLELQIYINSIRHEYNIPDFREICNVDDDKSFVQ